MRYEVLTVKILPEVMADLEAFALEKFPKNCPKCDGEGTINGKNCPSCGGGGQVGDRSEATRFLLHFSLGKRATPEARAMLAVYAKVCPHLIGSINKVAHQAGENLHQEIIGAIEMAGFLTKDR